MEVGKTGGKSDRSAPSSQLPANDKSDIKTETGLKKNLLKEGDNMEIVIDSRDQFQIVRVTGNLDGKTAQMAQDTIMPLLTEECWLVFDLCECDMITSAGLRILLMFAKQIKKQRGRGVISGLTEEVNDVMEMTGFSNMFKAYASVDDAITALGKGTI